MPGDEISTRRRMIGTCARLRMPMSIVAAASLPDPKKSGFTSRAPRSGCGMLAGRLAAVVPHAARTRIDRIAKQRCMKTSGFVLCSGAMKKLIMILMVAATAASASAQDRLTRLLRQPDIHGDQVAFVYAGDLWIASAKGG